MGDMLTPSSFNRDLILSEIWKTSLFIYFLPLPEIIFSFSEFTDLKSRLKCVTATVKRDATKIAKTQTCAIPYTPETTDAGNER